MAGRGWFWHGPARAVPRPGGVYHRVSRAQDRAERPCLAAEGVAMMAEPNVGGRRDDGLHGDQVDPDRQPRDGSSVGQAILEQPADGRPKVGSLAVVEGLLGEPEVPPAAPANLDDDEERRRTRVDRHEIELVATDMDVPGQDGPALIAQASSDQLLGGVTRHLSGRSTGGGAPTVHRPMIAGDPHRTVARPLTATHPGLHLELRCGDLQALEIDHVECRVVGHDRDELALEEVVYRRGRRRIAQQIEIELIAGERSLEGQEAASVERCQALSPDRVAMVPRRVPLVVLPAVARVASREARHHPVPDHLRHDGGAGDRVAERVSVDDRRVWPDVLFEPDDPIAIYEHMLLAADPGDRPTHREMRGVVDVKAIDLGDRCGPDTDGHRTGANERGESLALGHGERLRVTNARNAMAAGPHDDRRGDDGATRRGDTDLVDTDDAGQAIAPQMALEAERRDGDRHRTTA